MAGQQKVDRGPGAALAIYPPGLPAFPGQFSNYIPSNNTLVVGGVGGNPNNGGLVDHLTATLRRASESRTA